MKEKIFLNKSSKPDKRFEMVFPDKTIHFGSGKLKGKGTYLEHKDDTIKKNWIKRHKVREDHNNPKTAGALSRHLLWGKKTLNDSIKAFEKKFKKYDIVKRI